MPEYRPADRFLGLFQADGAVEEIAADTIEHHASQLDPWLHALAPEHQGGRGAAHGRHVDYQNHRALQSTRQRSRARVLRGADAVKQPHDTLDHRNIGIAHAAAENAAQGELIQQPYIQVAGRATGRLSVQSWIDVVRTGFEGRRSKTLALPGGENADGNRRLADRAVRACQKDSGRHDGYSWSGAVDRCTRPSAVNVQRFIPLTKAGALSARR